MKIDRGFRHIQDIGYFFAGFTVFDERGDLHFLGSEQYLGIGKFLKKGRNDVIQVGLNDVNQGPVLGFQAGIFQLLYIG